MATARFCGQCGVELKPQARFCGACGKPVKPADAAEDTAARPPPRPEPPTADDAPASPAQNRTEPVRRPKPAPAPPNDRPGPAPDERPSPVDTPDTPIVPIIQHPVRRRTAQGERLALIGGAVAVVLLGGGAFAWWTGAIGDRPVRVAAAINARLVAQGVPTVSVVLDRKWNAQVVGEVFDPALKARALDLVRSDGDIRTIFDQVVVRNPAQERLAAAQAAMAGVSTPGVTLASSADGMVIVGGTADSEAERQAAISAVQGAVGSGLITVQVGRSPMWIQRDLVRQFAASGLNGVNVQVSDSRSVMLSGAVSTAAERLMAEQLSRAGGLEAVRNDIVVAVTAPERLPDRAMGAPTTRSPSRVASAPPPRPTRLAADLTGYWRGGVTFGFISRTRYDVKLNLSGGRPGDVVGEAFYTPVRRREAEGEPECRASLVYEGMEGQFALLRPTLDRMRGSYLCSRPYWVTVARSGDSVTMQWSQNRVLVGNEVRAQLHPDVPN